MCFHLNSNQDHIHAKIQISGSKSETNRLLILQALYPNIEIKNPSNSDDSRVLVEALNNQSQAINIEHAGTAMRFLTAFYAFSTADKILDGSERMSNRPIKILVESLRKLGADITYLQKEGYPPLHISGKKPRKNYVGIKADVSSQYISALLLIAPKIPEGIELHLTGKVLSKPYIEMTLRLLHQIGIKTNFKDQIIRVFPKKEIATQSVSVEPDWSSASYFYSIAALAEKAEIHLKNFRKNSLQGDSVLAKIYEEFGLETTFLTDGILLQKKENFQLNNSFEMDLTAHPDLAQTLAVTCLGLQINCRLTGLNNLKIKETDRLQALKNELSKFGAKVKINDSSLTLQSPRELKKNICIKTYEDHRMAMCFAPLALKTELYIQNPKVVRKSFPDFWKKIEKCGITTK